MLSVTKRVKMVSQPKGGYVPKSLFKVEHYIDNNQIKDVNVTLSSIQGLAVDYLTRFMLFGDKTKAFDIPIRGAKLIDDAYENNCESDNVMHLLKDVTGLDRKSVISTCRIVCYDSAYRMGIGSYKSADNLDIDEDLFSNIPILVDRTLQYFDIVGPVVKDAITFDGGYTKLISSGDGDFLTKDSLIDLKVSKKVFSSKWSLQLLVYYLLGIHSIHNEFAAVKKICIFNPYLNQSYICNLKDIDDKTKYVVSHDVIGYKMEKDYYRWDRESKSHVEDYSSWKRVSGTDGEILKQFLTDNFTITDFNLDRYEDGIFDISLDDYWTFLTTTFDEYKYALRPIFPFTESVKLLKHNGYYMFVSVSSKGNYSLLHGARLHKLKYPLEYYYDSIERYATAVIMHFHKYWDALREISKQIQSIEPTESFYRSRYSFYLDTREFFGVPEEDRLSFDDWYSICAANYKLSGKIHGCIVDIDYFNHIFLNPYDGTITPYNAESKYDKKVYRNTRSLLSSQRPEMLPAFDKMMKDAKNKKALLSFSSKTANSMIISPDDKISQDFVRVYDYDMYNISDKLKPLQNIYDMNLIQIWYNEILNDDRKLLKSKYGINTGETARDEYINQIRKQKNGLDATVVNYKNIDDIDVQFEDGFIVEHTDIGRWKRGTIQHPNYVVEKKVKVVSEHSVKDKYIGLTKTMKCGLQATVIDYKDCKNVTVRFEDGLIKTGVRSDHFMNCNVSHKP